MTPARWPREDARAERMLVVDRARRVYDDARVGDLPRLLRAGDLLVVNDAATIPGSLRGEVDGRPIEVRLVAEQQGSWLAIAFGGGDWRTRTEDREPAPPLHVSQRIELGLLSAVVEHIDHVGDGRRLTLRFEGSESAFWSSLGAVGRPIQYAHLADALAPWHVQNAYASRPWAAEMPSAGHALRWGLLQELRAHGVALARVTHAAGISSTGDAELDATLPWPERFEVSAETVRAIADTRRAGGRVVAVGTSVVRALESAGAHAASGITSLRIGPEHRLQIVDAIFTGVHEIGTSHRDLLAAFAPTELLEAAYAHAERAGYLGHEFGDATLVFSSSVSGEERAQ